MIEFGSWLMPVQYSGIGDEHLTVRRDAGLFDISHMGQFVVNGPRAGAWLNGLLTNNIERLSPGHGQYTFLLNDSGGVIDDLIVYRLREEEYLLIVNAAKVERGFRSGCRAGSKRGCRVYQPQRGLRGPRAPGAEGAAAF